MTALFGFLLILAGIGCQLFIQPEPFQARFLVRLVALGFVVLGGCLVALA